MSAASLCACACVFVSPRLQDVPARGTTPQFQPGCRAPCRYTVMVVVFCERAEQHIHTWPKLSHIPDGRNGICLEVRKNNRELQHPQHPYFVCVCVFQVTLSCHMTNKSTPCNLTVEKQWSHIDHQTNCSPIPARSNWTKHILLGTHINSTSNPR